MNNNKNQNKPSGFVNNNDNNKDFRSNKIYIKDETDVILDVGFKVLQQDSFVNNKKKFKNLKKFDNENKDQKTKNVKKSYKRGSFVLELEKKPLKLKDLSNLMKLKTSALSSFLFKNGFKLKENDLVDCELFDIIAPAFNIKLLFKNEITIDSLLKERFKNLKFEERERPPVVSVLGHVDHGKTTLLDTLRETSFADREIGGITQNTSCCKVSFKNKSITFVDTPGHAAFFNMRSNSSNVSDLALLVIAADDGINQQTLEIIEMLKNSNMPIVIAINKIDKVSNPSLSIQEIKNRLLSYDIVVEDFGGDVICVDISAKNNINIDKLLDTILLQVEMFELKSRFEGYGKAQVLDVKVDKNLGLSLDLLVKEGQFKVGDFLISENYDGKVRILKDLSSGKNLNIATVSDPVKVYGFSEELKIGHFIYSLSKKDDFDYVKTNFKFKNEIENKEDEVGKKDLFFDNEEKMQFKIIIVAESKSLIDAIVYAISEIKIENSEIKIINTKAGEVGDSDLDMAKTTKSSLYVFGSKINKKIIHRANTESITCKEFHIIYDLIKDVEDSIKKLYQPLYEEVQDGSAEVRNIFNISKTGIVYGCMVTNGSVIRNNFVRVKRGNEIIFNSKISSLRRIKEDVKDVSKGFECGISLEDKFEIKIGDILEVYHKVVVSRFK